MSEAETNETAKELPILGSYRFLRPLGTGGMSSVFHAVHIESGHQVAVKVLPRVLAKNPTMLQRFMREAKNAEALEHKNIASILDRGFDQGRHYLVLEYVEGGDLNDRVKGSGPLALTDAVKAIRAVAEGLHYALSQGVIHRDIKPANLLLTPSGQIKIIDLGLALQTEGEDERVTRDGTTVGTVDYMSPEQARDSRATSERSDIYSLGCTLFFLITGKPPFPGGDIVNKLGRHCLAPIPDVRELRPEASEPLARLIQTMMAKKPANRYGNYEALISAIDRLPELGGEVDSGPRDVLIADDEPGLVPETTSFPGTSSGFKSSLSMTASSKSGMRPASNAEVDPIEISLATLSEDKDRPPQSGSKATASPVAPVDLEAHYFESEDAPPIQRSTSRPISLSTWVAAGALVGLSIALVGVGVAIILSPATPPTRTGTVDARGEEQGTPQNELANEVAHPISSVSEKASWISTKKVATKPTPVVWTEPTDSPKEDLPEPRYPADVEASSLPDWAQLAIPNSIEGPSAVLRRVLDPANDSYVASLRTALDKNGGVVEIADNGPFFEDDFRLAGKAKLIRARAGYRPMLTIKISPTSLAVVRDRPSVFLLDGTSLILDGLDLIVDARDLPPAKTSLFLLKGAELTLNSCTLTILNASTRPFTSIRLDDPGDDRVKHTSRVRVERTLIRDSSSMSIDLNGPAELVFNRSIILGGLESLIGQGASTARGDRLVQFTRSLVATRGSVVEVSGNRTIPLQIRAVGSTFAKVSGVNDSGFIRARNDLAAPSSALVDWRGHDNHFVGWPAWFSSGTDHKSEIASLARVHEIWPGVDDQSREAKRRWPASVLADDSTAASLRDLSEEHSSILARVATPAASLLSSTVVAFARQPLPVMPPRRITLNYSGAAPPPVEPKLIDLTFEVQDATWRGDLGLFLARKISAGSPKTRIRVVGGGDWKMTPVRLPDGVSVEIESTAVPGQEPAWTIASRATGAALIELSKGDLSLKGIHLNWSSSARVPHVLRVEDGHLLLSGCVIRTGDGAMPAGTSLVQFRAAGTRPLATAAGPFLSETDRPILRVIDSSLIAIGGEAIAAELGRGIVSLVNTAIIQEGEGAALRLIPQKVARARFEADLSLDNCSVAAVRTFVQIEAWPGANPGADRPWLVSSKKSVFLEIAPRGRRESVLLRSRDGALDHGTLFWQANGDAYDLPHFTIAGDGLPPAGRQRPDVKAKWTDFWGTSHIVSVVGPNPRGTEPVLTLKAGDRLRPGGLSAESLRLDPKKHRGVGVDLRYLPPRLVPPASLLGASR